MPTKSQEELLYTSVKTGVPTDVKVLDVIDSSDIFLYNGRHIIKLEGFQKLADAENIVEKKFETLITPNKDNHQQHGVNVWVGFKNDNNPDNWERASGEASTLNTGKYGKNSKGEMTYSEISSIDSQYKLAMADKRAYCRAVLKLLKIRGAYSEVESPDFLAAGAKISSTVTPNYDL